MPHPKGLVPKRAPAHKEGGRERERDHTHEERSPTHEKESTHPWEEVSGVCFHTHEKSSIHVGIEDVVIFILKVSDPFGHPERTM